LHALVASHVLEQTWLLPQASCTGQSAEVLQPQDAPPSHTPPLVEVVQLAQEPPLAPHALGTIPETHTFDVEQQPPLHPVVPLPHVTEQVWLVVLHACPAGQSVTALHPHDPLARHACPALLVVQSTHSDSLAPHWVWLVPDAHVPDVPFEQHPVAHGSLVLQVNVQIPPEQPEAPVPQSVTEPQPHCPPLVTGSQACP
jgi:hypothetical protein